MKAVLCKAWAEPSALVIEEIESLPPSEGQVRITVHACGVNFADTLIVQGKYQVKPPLPFSPGLEVAGVVDVCGAGVKTLQPGQRVVAVCDYGGFAEMVTVSQERVIPIPAEMDFITAAAFPIAYGTSHLALIHRAHLQPGESLLVHGAAGGVGLAAVEIGHQIGATVIATAGSPEKLELAARYGADHLIDYSRDDFRERVKDLTGGKGADVIFDPVGGDVFDQSLRCINWEGRLLVIGFAGGRIPQVPAGLVLVKNVAIIGLYWGAYAYQSPQVLRRSMAELFDWYQQGKLKPHISQIFPLEAASLALESLIKRQSTGKVVLVTEQGRRRDST